MPRQYKSEFKESEECLKWKNRIAKAKSRYENYKEKNGWKRFKMYFKNKYEEALGLKIPAVVVNEVYAYAKTATANLYNKNPYIAVNPERADSVHGAMIKEVGINYFWREWNLKKSIKMAILEAKLIGRGWIKLGYDADIVSYQAKEEDEVNDYIKGEKLWARYIPAQNIYYDETAIDPPHDCRWLIHWYLKPTEALKAKYKKKDIKPSFKEKSDDKSKPDFDMNLVYEIWDKDSGYKLLYTDGLKDEFLEKIPPADEGCIGPYKIEGMPFEMLSFNEILSMERGEDDDDNFPMSDILPQEPQILEKIKIRSMQMNHIKRFSRQLMTLKGAMAKSQKSIFEQGIDGSIFEVEGSDVRNVVAAVPYPPLQTDIYAVEGRIDVDRDKISGQSQLEQGGPAISKTRTMGEVEQSLKSTSARREDEIDSINGFCEGIARKLIQLMKQFFDIPQYAGIVGDIPREYLKELANQGKFDGVSVKFTKEDIQGDEDVEIVYGSTRRMDKDTKLAYLLQILRFGAAIGLTPESFSAKAVGTAIFREIDMPEISRAYQLDLQRMMQPKQPDPKQQMDLLKRQQDMKKSVVDTELKKARKFSVDLRNTHQALGNAEELRGRNEVKEMKKERVQQKNEV